MKCINSLLFVFVALLSACAYLPVQPPVASALDNPGLPFKSGISISKPVPTPSLELASLQSETIASTPVPPAETPLPTEAPISEATDAEIQLAFPEDAFVINDDYQPPAVGYDSTTPNDSPPEYNGSKYILVDISEQHMYVYEGGTLVYSFVSSTGMNNSTLALGLSVYSTKSLMPTGQPGTSGCRIGWESTGPGVSRTASMPCQFSPMGPPSGQVIWAPLSRMVVWFSAPTKPSRSTTGPISAHRSRFAGRPPSQSLS